MEVEKLLSKKTWVGEYDILAWSELMMFDLICGWKETFKLSYCAGVCNTHAWALHWMKTVCVH